MQTFHSSAVSTYRACHGPQHALRLCPTFIEMSPTQRLNHVKNLTCSKTVSHLVIKRKRAKTHVVVIYANKNTTVCSIWNLNHLPTAHQQRNQFNKSSTNQNTISLISLLYSLKLLDFMEELTRFVLCFALFQNEFFDFSCRNYSRKQ